MKRNYLFFVSKLLLIALLSAQCNHSLQAPQLGEAPIDDVVAAMTLEEKAMLLVGTGMAGGEGNEEREAPVVGVTNNIVPGAAGTTFAIERLGIPAIVLADGPAGLRISPTRENDENTYYCTAFPIETSLASSWNTALVEEAGKTIGEEIREYGVDVLLAPALNIHRHPLGGRNFEYYSEDPLISGKMAAAMVNGVQAQGVGTSIKHLAANNQETERRGIDTKVSPRALREIYLKGFEIAVKKSSPWTVMSSYNKINGTEASHNTDLLTSVLREDWGFEGMVMTDWFGGTNATEQVIAGNDLLMPGAKKQMNIIIDAVKTGTLDEKLLDRNVKRVLELVMKTPCFKGIPFSNKPDLNAHADVSRRLATEGMVLLKNNNNALPLEKVQNIAAFGFGSYDFIADGTGSGDVNEAYTVSLVKGLANAGYIVDTGLEAFYTNYISEEKPKVSKPRTFHDPIISIPEADIPISLIEEMAAVTDVAFISIGRISGEFKDRDLANEQYKIGDYYLTQTEKNLITNVSKIFQASGKKAILILNVGGVIELTEVKDAPDAILLAWQPGLEAGNAIADVLSGKVNPSGHLATTFLSSVKELSGKTFPGTPASQPKEVTYDEGIYVGYRYYDTFGVKPLYEFGYGLSYTTFAYSNLDTKRESDVVKISVTVTNTGKKDGKEVAQVYVAAPKGKLDKPVQELRAFGKTNLLEPGESQVLSFELTNKDIASFDENQSAWITETGKYEVRIGASSRDIKLKAAFNVEEDVTVESVSKVLALQAPIDEKQNN
ncbi:Thermostable beta-glucosidase B [termite gut metagenome]|uniref:Thermostable beta-glucosidase B n=1 Tax=termite gut metagenome TaxID=433724 RepID=A0A5J4RPR5_9ZZZZ